MQISLWHFIKTLLEIAIQTDVNQTCNIVGVYAYLSIKKTDKLIRDEIWLLPKEKHAM